jgi:hypothetical protein
VRARSRPDPDDEDDAWEAIDPTADDLDDDSDDLDWWLENGDEDDAPPHDPIWPDDDRDEDD